MKEISDEIYIDFFNQFREKATCVANDDKLKAWGNSEESIRELKINHAKRIIGARVSELDMFRFLNQKLGGTNCLQ